MIVVEDERAGVVRVGLAADTRVTGTQVAAGVVRRRRGRRRPHMAARPGARLPMRRDDHPLLAERVPALLPHCQTDVIATPSVGRACAPRWGPARCELMSPIR